MIHDVIYLHTLTVNFTTNDEAVAEGGKENKLPFTSVKENSDAQ